MGWESCKSSDQAACIACCQQHVILLDPGGEVHAQLERERGRPLLAPRAVGSTKLNKTGITKISFRSFQSWG